MSYQEWIKTAAPPEHPEPKASIFAEWVYEFSQNQKERITVPSKFKYRQLQLGKIAHSDIDLFFQFKWTQEKLKPGSFSEWDVIYTDSDAKAGNVYEAGVLRVNESPMRCAPDAVLRHKSENKILIIERKTTNVPEPKIPTGGWPNVQAQLWCYSWIDDWLGADEVLLVGQLWHRSRGVVEMCHSHPMWKRNDASFHQRCLMWFERYGGVFVGSGSVT